MDRKPKPNAFIEPMPKKEFHKLIKEFKKQGGVVLMDKNAEYYLDIKGSEAVTLNENTILFRKNPSRAAVYEELFHVQQFRSGKIDGSIYSTCINEVEAKQHLLENAERYQLSKNEIEQTKHSLGMYQKKLDSIRKGEAK